MGEKRHEPSTTAVYWPAGPVVVIIILGAWLAARETPQAPAMKKWRPGQRWGWVLGPADQIGSLNEMGDHSRLAALRLVPHGKVYDLGVLYDRTSFKWPGHNSARSFRSAHQRASSGSKTSPWPNTPWGRPGTVAPCF